MLKKLLLFTLSISSLASAADVDGRRLSRDILELRRNVRSTKEDLSTKIGLLSGHDEFTHAKFSDWDSDLMSNVAGVRSGLSEVRLLIDDADNTDAIARIAIETGLFDHEQEMLRGIILQSPKNKEFLQRLQERAHDDPSFDIVDEVKKTNPELFLRLYAPSSQLHQERISYKEIEGGIKNSMREMDRYRFHRGSEGTKTWQRANAHKRKKAKKHIQDFVKYRITMCLDEESVSEKLSRYVERNTLLCDEITRQHTKVASRWNRLAQGALQKEKVAKVAAKWGHLGIVLLAKESPKKYTGNPIMGDDGSIFYDAIDDSADCIDEKANNAAATQIQRIARGRSTRALLAAQAERAMSLRAPMTPARGIKTKSSAAETPRDASSASDTEYEPDTDKTTNIGINSLEARLDRARKKELAAESDAHLSSRGIIASTATLFVLAGMLLSRK